MKLVIDNNYIIPLINANLSISSDDINQGFMHPTFNNQMQPEYTIDLVLNVDYDVVNIITSSYEIMIISDDVTYIAQSPYVHNSSISYDPYSNYLQSNTLLTITTYNLTTCDTVDIKVLERKKKLEKILNNIKS